jgi:hypothetical protein
LHGQIFDLVYYGKGGFTWSDVYNMPVFMRLFYTKSIEKALKAKNEAEKKANKNIRKPTSKRPSKS